MKRTRTNPPSNISLPDLINHSNSQNFTQVPNEALRNPLISGKAKALLCLLLSNKEGWKSYIVTLCKMMKEGKNAITSGLEELEEFGYLIRVRYRCQKTKVWKGSFWCYTDTPYCFNNISKTIKKLRFMGMEPQPDFPRLDNPDLDNPDLDNRPLIIYNNKKTKKKKINGKEASAISVQITSKLFEEFWNLYPRKINKGQAIIAWEKLCNNQKKRPKWKLIKRAILKQKKSERWQDPKFIPYPTTWLNQMRWLDNPEEMVNPYKDKKIEDRPPEEVLKTIKEPYQRDKLLEVLKDINNTYQIPQVDLANNLKDLFGNIAVRQKQNRISTPSPAYLIEDYFYWIKKNDWINGVSANTFQFNSKLFGRFIEDYIDDNLTNPITGK